MLIVENKQNTKIKIYLYKEEKMKTSMIMSSSQKILSLEECQKKFYELHGAIKNTQHERDTL